MARLIGIGEVFTVPSEKNIAAMEGGEGEVMGISAVLHGHNFVCQNSQGQVICGCKLHNFHIFQV